MKTFPLKYLFLFLFFCFVLNDARAEQITILKQPDLKRVVDYFVVPKLTGHAPRGEFFLALWQPNPFRSNGLLVSSSWPAGDRTGFYPVSPQEAQLSFEDKDGSTTVQAEGDTVGAYVTSKDLPEGSHKNKMMITPAVRFKKSDWRPIFKKQTTSLVVSLDLQIPTAKTNPSPAGKSMSHVSSDLQFMNRKNKQKISYGTNLFFYGYKGGFKGCNVAYDEDSKSIMANCPIDSKNTWISMDSQSNSRQGQPWKGWKTFKYTVTYLSFKEALEAVIRKYPNSGISTDPEDYYLIQYHLNAELHFEGGPSELGWSMRHLSIESIDPS